jgi:N-acetylglucosamine-6-phosphate deacetylase
MRIRARHYATGQPVEVVWEAGVVQSVDPPGSARADLEAGWIAPALFDLQINGALGVAFTSDRLSPQHVIRVTDVVRERGVAAFCPTVITHSFSTMAHALRTIRAACEATPEIEQAAPVIHLEGPYLSPDDGPRGAHPRGHIRPPDWDEFRRFQEAAGGRVRLVTLAPEWPDCLRLIERLVEAGVVVALGHTAANGPRIRDAVTAGARLSTHLGNGAHAVLPRHDNYIWEQLAEDRLWSSVISDGQHLPPAVVRSIVRVKTPARTILTCDASSLAGMPPGSYREWEQELEVLAEGKIVVKGSGYLAGSWTFTDICVANVMAFADVSLAEAIDMASARPRELLGLPPWQLQPGSLTPLMLFDWENGKSLELTRVLLPPPRPAAA